MFGRIGVMELILIFSIALIIFGPKKLPEIGRALGSAIRNFKRHANSLTDELDQSRTSESDGDSESINAKSETPDNKKAD